MTRKKGRIKLFSLPRSRTYSIEAYASGVASPQPVSIYPVALQLMCSRVEPSPPLLPSSQTAPNFSPLSTSTLTVPPLLSSSSSPPPKPTQLRISGSPQRENISLSLPPSLPPHSPRPSLFSFLRSVSRTFSSSSHRSLFVLEIRTGLPNPPFQLRCY